MAALRTWNVAWGLALVAVLVALARAITDDDDVAVATAWLGLLVPGTIAVALTSGGGSELPAAALRQHEDLRQRGSERTGSPPARRRSQRRSTATAHAPASS